MIKHSELVRRAAAAPLIVHSANARTRRYDCLRALALASSVPKARSRCGFLLPGKTILETSVPELIYRPDCTNDATLPGIVEESHEVYRGLPTPGQLSSSE
jgi:hypothetical protein